MQFQHNFKKHIDKAIIYLVALLKLNYITNKRIK